MPTTCPVCGQAVQQLDDAELRQRVEKLASPLLRQERQKLEREFDERLGSERRTAQEQAEKRLKTEYERRLSKEREAGAKEAEKGFKKQLAEAEKKAADADRKVEAAKAEIERRLEKQSTAAVQQAVRESEKRADKEKTEREKDRLRHEAEKQRLQTQLDSLSRKLEGQTGEELGEDGERDLAVLLRQEFPGDRVERIPRGHKGADILHHVIDQGKVCGKIVYESKNVSQWQNTFVAQAKKHQTQYETPHVVIVSSVFPGKKKSMCIYHGIPVVSLRTAVPLASIMRSGIIAIAELKLTDVARDEKSRELFEYIIGDRFGTKFHEMAGTIDDLREQQRKEQSWHQNTWEARSKLHERLDSRHREIHAQLRSITNREAPVLRLAAKA